VHLQGSCSRSYEVPKLACLAALSKIFDAGNGCSWMAANAELDH